MGIGEKYTIYKRKVYKLMECLVLIVFLNEVN